MTERFARVPIAAAGMQGLGQHALRVLIALCAHVGKNGQCFPSLSTIAKVCRLDRRQIPRAIGRLISTGLVTKVNGSAGRSSTYQLHYELTSPEMSALTSLEMSSDAATDISGDDRVTSLEMSKVPSTDIPGDALTDQEYEKPNEQKEEGLFRNHDAPDDLTLAQQAWNDLATELQLAKASDLKNGRKSKLKARLKQAGGLQGWSTALDKVREATWMHGANERGWRADFDFMLQPKNFTKLMEGAYDQNRKSAGNGSVGRNGFTALFAEESRRRPD
jgi:hypothetical protein